MRLGIDWVSTVGSRFDIIARGYDEGMWERRITDSVLFVVIGVIDDVRLAVVRVDEKGRVVVVNCRRCCGAGCQQGYLYSTCVSLENPRIAYSESAVFCTILEFGVTMSVLQIPMADLGRERDH